MTLLADLIWRLAIKLDKRAFNCIPRRLNGRRHVAVGTANWLFNDTVNDIHRQEILWRDFHVGRRINRAI